MARSASLTNRYQPLLRRLGVVAGISLLLTLLLVSYTFGGQNQFFSRLFNTFSVLFWLLAVTFLGIVPFVRWAADSWFGRSWTGSAPGKNSVARSSPSPTRSRTPTRPALRSQPKKTP